MGVKKILSFLLAGALLATLAAPAMASDGFSDVLENKWYTAAVKYVGENGLFLGESDGKFHPDSPMSRAMLTQVLARKTTDYKKEEWTGKSSFTDVSKTVWYAAPVEWATKSGIADGVGNNRFQPEKPVTREEMAVMLYHYAQRTGSGISSQEGAGGKFTDAAQTSPWAAAAVDWAVSNKVINGYPDETLRPNRAISRAEAACVLHASADVLKSTEILYPKDTPLPKEIGISGEGRDIWKIKEYLCKEFEELHGFAPELPKTGPEEVTGLPVYKENTYQPTEQLKADLKKAAEDFLISAGRKDLVDAGLVPNEELLNDAKAPVYHCTFADFTLTVGPERISLQLDLPAVKGVGESGMKALLRENPLLAAMCKVGGIDAPLLLSNKNYTVSGSEFTRLITVVQNSDDETEAVKNTAFSSLFLSSSSESDTVVVNAARPGTAQELGKYVLLPYNEALAQLKRERGVQSGDVLGYKLEYDTKITAGYCVPYYKFYFESPKKDTSPIPSGYHEYTEYGVRAVKN